MEDGPSVATNPARSSGVASWHFALQALAAYGPLDVFFKWILVYSFIDRNPGTLSAGSVQSALAVCWAPWLGVAWWLCRPIARWQRQLALGNPTRDEIERAGRALYRFPMAISLAWSTHWFALLGTLGLFSGNAFLFHNILTQVAVAIGPFPLGVAMGDLLTVSLVRELSLAARATRVTLSPPPLTLRRRLAIDTLCICLGPTFFVASLTFSSQARPVTFEHLLITFSVFASGIGIYTVLIASFLARTIARPLAEMADIMHAITQKGDVSNVGRVPLYKRDETGLLADVVNRTLDRLEIADRERQDAAASLRALNQSLEQRVEERTAELKRRTDDMRLVLDNVEQGLFTVDATGTMASEHSASIESWFGLPPAGEPFYRFFGHKVPLFGEQTRVAWEQVVGGDLPLEVSLAQMPKSAEADGRYFRFSYAPISDSEHRYLGVVSDITAAIEHERTEQDRKETLVLFERVMGAERAAFASFMADSSDFVARIAHAGTDTGANLRRDLHTLKGNAAIYGLESVARFCHDLEGHLAEGVTTAFQTSLEALCARWSHLELQFEQLIGGRRHVIELTREQQQGLMDAIRVGTSGERLLELVREFELEPASGRLGHFAGQARRLANRLKKEVDVVVVGNDFRFDPRRWSLFWGAFIHAVRNALDHGIEPADERVQLGKPRIASLQLRAERAADLLIAIEDDGRGIAWEAVRERAQRSGLPASTRQDLEAALFTDGLSTTQTVTDTSGRGVGLGALRDAVQALGGHIEIASETGTGTAIRLRFPLTSAR